MNKIAALALVLAGCASEPDPQADVDLAWKACAGVEPSEVHSECLRDQYRRQEAQGTTSGDTTTTLLMMLNAFMSGYNQSKVMERASAP